MEEGSTGFSQFSVQNGDTVRDTVTGFEGQVIGTALWLHSSPTVVIQGPGQHEGRPTNPYVCEMARCIRIEATQEYAKGTGFNTTGVSAAMDHSTERAVDRPLEATGKR